MQRAARPVVGPFACTLLRSSSVARVPQRPGKCMPRFPQDLPSAAAMRSPERTGNSPVTDVTETVKAKTCPVRLNTVK
jgi:hypothetical protein